MVSLCIISKNSIDRAKTTHAKTVKIKNLFAPENIEMEPHMHWNTILKKHKLIVMKDIKR